MFNDIFAGTLSDDEVARFLSELHRKGETVSDILQAADAAWSVRAPLGWTAPAGAIDTCGTGGDGLQTFNVSTTVALAAAAYGIPVVKHGNRAMSSKSGSADLLQSLGFDLEPSREEARRMLAERRFVFLFAPLYHPAFKRAAHIRKALGHRTIFNLLGPLLNPAEVKRQVIGVYAPEWVEPMAQVLLARGAKRALVVHGHNTDELTTWGESLVAEVSHGQLTTRRFRPPTQAPSLADVQDITLPRQVLLGKANTAAMELTALNLAAALWVAKDDTPPFEASYAEALDFLRSGQAATNVELSHDGPARR